jgi:hypothetical protein
LRALQQSIKSGGLERLAAAAARNALAEAERREWDELKARFIVSSALVFEMQVVEEKIRRGAFERRIWSANPPRWGFGSGLANMKI